jgi:hypothetical protein
MLACQICSKKMKKGSGQSGPILPKPSFPLSSRRRCPRPAVPLRRRSSRHSLSVISRYILYVSYSSVCQACNTTYFQGCCRVCPSSWLPESSDDGLSTYLGIWSHKKLIRSPVGAGSGSFSAVPIALRIPYDPHGQHCPCPFVGAPPLNISDAMPPRSVSSTSQSPPVTRHARVCVPRALLVDHCCGCSDTRPCAQEHSQAALAVVS